MKKCVIMGNGPSLNKVNIDDLRSTDTFSFNRAYLAYDEWDFYPTFYGCIDCNRLKDCHEGIQKIIDKGLTKKLFLHKSQFVIDNFSSYKSVVCILKREKVWIANNKDHGMFTLANLPSSFKLGPNCWGSVCGTAVQFLYALGYTHVGMVGVDAHYPRKGKTHFRDDYVAKGDVVSFDAGNDLGRWSIMKQYLSQSKKMKVYSCTEGSHISSIFGYIKLSEFIGSIK